MYPPFENSSTRIAIDLHKRINFDFCFPILGFVEAGPQFALQLSLLIRGGWGPSSRAVLAPFIPVTLPPMNTTFIGEDTGDENLEITTVLPEFLEESKYNGSLVIFDRIYDEGK